MAEPWLMCLLIILGSQMLCHQQGFFLFCFFTDKLRDCSLVCRSQTSNFGLFQSLLPSARYQSVSLCSTTGLGFINSFGVNVKWVNDVFSGFVTWWWYKPVNNINEGPMEFRAVFFNWWEKMLNIYFEGHTMQFSNFYNLFTRHDRKWASVLVFLE